MDPMAAPQEFDLFTQPFNITLPDGSTRMYPMQILDESRIFIARLATNYGAQIGATIMLLLVLMLLTRSEKRKAKIFIINASCLVVNTIRCILLTCYTTSPMFNPYAQLSGDWSRVTTGNLATTITASIFTLIVSILVMVSLSMQVWVVCVTTAPVQRYIIMAATTLVALVAVGYKAASVILASQETLAFEASTSNRRIYQEGYIAQAVAIWFFSCIFTYKLGYAIYQRRKLKMPQFGPMQIVFIMGCQTMLIPGPSPTPSFTLYFVLTLLPSHLHLPPIPPRIPRTRRRRPHHRVHLPASLRHLGRRR
jgi:pheromone alpha factor receptor